MSCVKIDMDDPRDMQAHGPFDARYLAFLETITQLRPRLHRYCSRMTGSVMDGEDIVQDALFEAYRKLDQYDDARPLAPWLFRIAHNRCIDFLRRRGVRVEAETAAMSPDSVMPDNPPILGIGRAVEQLVMSLPPKERACVLLKDVFDYTLEEIAELVGSTVGAVKADSTGADRNWQPRLSLPLFRCELRMEQAGRSREPTADLEASQSDPAKRCR
jgi:RNA polymerase sigma-70 factor (ECF subfamily)